MSNPIVPVSNPNGAWATWNYNDIYTGPSGTGIYVPKVGDLVAQLNGSTLSWYVVTAVAAGSMLSTLVQCINPTNTGDFSQADLLFGVSPAQPDTFIVYIDKSVNPYRVTIDSRYVISGTSPTSYQLFEGTNLGQTAKVISATYDSNGNFTGTVGALELVATTLYTNIAVQVPKTCYTSANLVDGEIVTAVFYNASGSQCSARQFKVVNTGFVRSTNGYMRSVIGVGLITPFLSATNSTTINNPINVNLTAANLIGVVYYSDGTSSTMAIDGVKFSVSGLSSYTPTAVGQSFPIVASYVLQAGEVGYGLNGANAAHITNTYTVVATNPNLSYQVQLFVYPQWTGSSYILQWFLYDMNRSQATNVSSYVTVVQNTAAFKPTQYGTKQTLSVQINLNQVQPYYNSFNYTQNVDILLESPGSYRQTAGNPPNWYVSPVSGATPMFGAGAYATAYALTLSSTQLNLSGVYGSSYANWLAAYCTASMPLINSPTETLAPTPTHFNLVYNGTSTTYAISNWNQPLVLQQTFINSDTLFIEFFARTAQADLQIAVAGIPVYAINSTGSFI